MVSCARAITFGFAGLASLRLPKTTIAPTAEQEDEKEPACRNYQSSYYMVSQRHHGFTFLVAFAYRGGTDYPDLSGIGTATGKTHEASYKVIVKTVPQP